MSAPEETLRRPRAGRRAGRRSPRRVAVRAALGSVALGPVVGLVWWLTALGGTRGRGSSYLDLLQSVGAADAGYAVLCLLVGAAAGIWWVAAREEHHDARAIARLVGLLVGGLAAAVVAWLVGAGLARLVPVAVDGIDPEVVTRLSTPGPSAAVVAGALLWPLAVGVLVVVDTARELAWQALTRDRDA